MNDSASAQTQAGVREELKSRLRGRVVVIGVGRETCGDDAAGVVVARLLAERGVQDVIEAGASPEIETWRIRELKPDTVVFVDAVDFGGRAGDIAILQTDQLGDKGFDTHRAPLSLTMRYLESELRCGCFLIGIQPLRVAEGASLSEDVDRSSRQLAEMLGGLMRHRD